MIRISAAGWMTLSLGVVVLADTVADPDLWGHVRFGQDIVRTGRILRPDPYSYLSGGQAWINHEWLAEVIFALAYDAGTPGLAALKVTLASLLAAAAYIDLRRRGLGPRRAAPLWLASLVPLRMGLGTVRPQMFTYALFFLLLLVLRGAEAGRSRRLWAIPPLVALWANLHGGVLAGLGVIGLWGAVRLGGAVRRGAATAAGLALILAACGAAATLNPYGWRLLAFLARTATVPRPEIAEWAPLAIASTPGIIYLALLGVAAAGVLGSRRRLGVASLAVLGVTAIAPLIAGRHFPLFALAVVVLAGEHLADAWDRWRGGEGRDGSPRSRWLAAPLYAAAVLLIVLAAPRLGCIRLDPGYFPFPTRAVALLKLSGVGGNLAVHFDWGEYALWHLAPHVKVSLDGRRETVYPEAIYREQLAFRDGRGDWDALLRRPETTLVLIARGYPVANLMRLRPGWTLIYQDSLCALYARAGSPAIGALAATPIPRLPPDGSGLCFPGPGARRRGWWAFFLESGVGRAESRGR